MPACPFFCVAMTLKMLVVSRGLIAAGWPGCGVSQNKQRILNYRWQAQGARPGQRKDRQPGCDWRPNRWSPSGPRPQLGPCQGQALLRPGLSTVQAGKLEVGGKRALGGRSPRTINPFLSAPPMKSVPPWLLPRPPFGFIWCPSLGNHKVCSVNFSSSFL